MNSMKRVRAPGLASWFRWLCLALLSSLLVACGGGGGGTDGSGTPPFGGPGSGGGGGTGGGTGPTVALSISSSMVTAVSPATVTVTVRDASGNPISGTVVALSTGLGTLANLSVASVATDANGSATVTLTAVPGGVSGADQVNAVATLGTTTVSGSVAFTVTGSSPTISLSISSTTLRVSTGSATMTATARDAAGNLVPNVLVSFTVASGRVALGAPSAMTNASGVAVVLVSPSDPTVTAADSITASATIQTVAVQSALVVQVVADVPTLTVMASGANVTATLPVSLTILVMDAAGKPVGAGTVVSISSTFGLTTFDATSVVTNASGLAQVSVSAKPGASGADQVLASATVGKVTVSALTVLQVSASTSMSITVSVSPATFTSASPAMVTVTALDAKGNPVPNVVVDLSTVRGTVASLSVASVSTGPAGTATATLSAASGGLGGADQVVGTATIGTTAIQGRASFTVAGSVASMGLTLSSTTLRASTGPVTMSALVKDATGAPVPSTVVAFSSIGGRVKLSAPSAVTNASGIATISVTVADASVTAGETLTASASVGAVSLQASSVVQLVAETPTLTMTTSNTIVTSIAPATLSILVKDAAGNPAGAGTIVSVSSVFGLSAFDATTILTNSSGLAQVLVSPKSAGSNGADQILASATVGGFAATAQTALQILSTGSTTVSVAVSPTTVTSATPATVTVTVRDSRGNAIPGTVVDLSTVKGTLAGFSLASILTNASGSATTSLQALGTGSSGADQVVAVARIGSSTVQGITGFSVSGSAPTIKLSMVNSLGQPSTTLRNSTGAGTLSAVVLDAAGVPAPNVQVTFASVGARVKLGAPTAMTDSAGKASIAITVADPSVTAADTLTASAIVNAVTVQSAFVLQLLPDTPTLSISVNPASGSVTAAAPLTLSVQVKDTGNNPVGAGVIVSISSNFGLTAFDANTAATDSSGIAKFVLTPKSATGSGADQVIASATVGGVAASAQTTLQVLAPGSLTVTLGLSSPVVTNSSPSTLSVLVRDSRGNPVSGTVVDLSVTRGLYASLNVASVLTDSSGNATATLSALGGGLTGSDQIVALAKIGTTTAQGSIGFNVTGSMATVNLSIVNASGVLTTTLRGATDGATLNALVKNAAGAAVPNIQVSFASAGGRVKLNATTAMTDATGKASVAVSATDPTVTAADTVSAITSVAGVTVQGSLVVQLLPAASTLELSASSITVTAAAPVTLSVKVFKNDGKNLVGAGTVVSISSIYGLSDFDANTAVTNSASIASFIVSPKAVNSNGADQIVATATVDGVTVSGQTVLQIQTPAANTVSVALSSPIITPASAATVTVTVRDPKGNPVPGAVVDLSFIRSNPIVGITTPGGNQPTLVGNLGKLTAYTVLTGASGSATTLLSVADNNLIGADEVVAKVRGGTATAASIAAFTVVRSPSATTLGLTISSTTLRGSTGAAALTAKLTDGGGLPVAGQQVAFASTSGKVKLNASSAVTDGSGLATVTASVADASVTAADTLTAIATVGGVNLQSQVLVQLLADTPSISISAPSSNVTSTTPVTLSILIRDTGGAIVRNAIVNVTSQFGLTAFDATTAATNASGVAQVVVTPKAANSNGADVIVASTNVGGVPVTAQFVVQVSSSTSTAPPVLTLALLNGSGAPTTSISSASPGTVRATLTDGKGATVAGEVVTFTVVRGLAKTNVGTALTDSAGVASVNLLPATSTTAGADEVSASAVYSGTTLQTTKGFQIQATNVTLSSFTSGLPAAASLSAYGQTTLTLGISGAAVGSPVNVSVSSACVSLGKATLSPASFTATTATVLLQYKDNGCGALQASDSLQANIVGGSGSVSLNIPIASPAASSLAFISASPEVIYIKGSGFTESSILTFEVRDGSGNVLPNLPVTLELLTESGGVTMQNSARDVVSGLLTVSPLPKSGADGRVTARVNSGTAPTPVRVRASLSGVSPAISTVSSNLSVAVGLPSQLNFSLSQNTRNIEGFNIDGIPNSYMVIASDRNGNPVPNGTSINFVAEGGQIQPIVATSGSQVGSPISAVAIATFQSSSPRPVDGRVTITAYALGEESFIDLNGNNIYDFGEPFQDLGNIFKDRNFDGIYDSSIEEFIPLAINNSSACVPASADPRIAALFAFDANLPSVGATVPYVTCDGVWSGAGKVYVRRAVETVLSTSAARPMWASTSGLTAACTKTTLQVGPRPTDLASLTQVQSGESWYGGQDGVLAFYVSDTNPGNIPNGFKPRFNPMAAGTTITASTSAKGLKFTVGGSPVPSTTEASLAAISYSFDPAVNNTGGTAIIDIKSPSGLITSYSVVLVIGAAPSSCPP